MTEHERPAQDEFWNTDEAIGEVTLWHGSRYSLRLKAHQQEEVYRQGKGEEIIPLKHQQGVRTYLLAKPYILVPDVTLDITLSPTPDPSRAIGEVAASRWEGMRHEELGTAQAWYYHEDRLLVLWEAYLFERYRSAGDLVQDANTYSLWEGMEGFLRQRFPQAKQLVTTYADPEYEPTEAYQAFLRTLGYEQISLTAFGKVRPAQRLPTERI